MTINILNENSLKRYIKERVIEETKELCINVDNLRNEFIKMIDELKVLKVIVEKLGARNEKKM